MNRFILFIFLTIVFAFDARSQMQPYMAVSDPEQIDWGRIIPSTTRLVIGGEAHTVSCNYPFQLGQLKYLMTKGYRNVVCEFPYSYSYIAQHYISTGNDSLLRFLAWGKEMIDYWKSIYELNRGLPEGDKLHIWGIDHELGDNGGWEYRKKIFVKAMELVVEGKGVLPPVLKQEFLYLKKDTTIQAIIDTKNRLRELVNHSEIISYLGTSLPHFIVLVNRLDHYKVNRNDEMFEAFNEICSLFRLDASSKFLAAFGWAHTDKSFKRSIAWLFQNHPSSPVKNNTFVIGVQYLNCGVTGRGKDFIENEGIIHNRSFKKALAAFEKQDPSPIKIFTAQSGEKDKVWSKSADVLFIFSGFPGITPLKKI